MLLNSEDIKIEEEEKTMDELKSEIMKLKSENEGLKARLSVQNSLEQTDIALTELIHEMREENNKIIMKKDEEGRQLRLKMDEIEIEKKMNDLKNERNNTIYNQKMSVIHDIEMENKIFKEEVNDLKKKYEEIKKVTKAKIESLDIINQLKFTQFKKKMIDNLKEAKNNVSKLNLEYMDLNGKITILQNYQLLQEVEFQKEQYDNLEREYKILKTRVIELEKELAIQKNVSIKLALKSKDFKEKIKIQSRNKKDKIEINMSNDNKGIIKVFPERNIFSNNIIREYSNKNNYNTIYNPTSRNNVFPFHLSSGRLNTNKMPEINFKYIKYNKIIKSKNEEIEKLNIIIDNLKSKFESFAGTNKSLFLFLEECLNNFFSECKENYLFKNINVNIDNIKKFHFENLKKEEQYGILVLLMKYLLPFIFINHEKINEKEKIFKTSINVNLIKKNLQYNSPDKYVKEVYLKKTFPGKKLISNLFIDNITIQNYDNRNIYKSNKKKDSPNDSRIKNNKFKSLIN